LPPLTGLPWLGDVNSPYSCDMRIASETSVFGFSEIDLGVFPGAGAAWQLPRVVGKSQALRMILTGDLINAEEALRIGLVDQVVRPERLMLEARALAGKIAKKNAWAVRLTKTVIHHSAEAHIDTARVVSMP